MEQKKKKKNSKLFETIVSVLVFVAGFTMIILFIYLVGQKFNEIQIKPGKVIYNNPGEVIYRDEEEVDDNDLGENNDDPEEDTTDGSSIDDSENANKEPEITEIDMTDDPKPDVQGVSTGWWSYPDVIVEIPVDQVRLDTVVDKGHKLKESYVPENLVTNSINGIGGIVTVTQDTLTALNKLGQAAQNAGITNLTVISSYRSYQTQASTYQYWVNYNGGMVDVADKISARPGHSEHQLGTVVDFSTVETGRDFAKFSGTTAYQWLLQNAAQFGFRQSYPEGMEEVTGYSAESWHWRYWGE